MKSLILYLCAAVLLLATNATAGPQVAPPGVGLSVTTDRHAYPTPTGNHPVNVRATATLTNSGTTPVTFTQGGRSVSWQIVDSAGVVVYDSNVPPRPMPMYVIRRVVDPGKSISFDATLPLQNADGATLPAGKYHAKAVLRSNFDLAASSDFTIGDGG